MIEQAAGAQDDFHNVGMVECLGETSYPYVKFYVLIELPLNHSLR